MFISSTAYQQYSFPAVLVQMGKRQLRNKRVKVRTTQ